MSDADQGAGDSEAVFAMLEELGVTNARELGLDHPGVVALLDASQQLDEGQPGLAMHTLEVELGEPDTPMPMEVGAAAFVLRGKAHEAQDRAYHARIDYEYALKMRPNIPYASEAIRRIDRRG
ncbi:MAG: hypothetical protein F4X03_13250 [Dehalococcoidia bacterium]|nr:hypothetical protein [Dehalococcoidia bacterium]MYD29857.1 hypothetical protein [Dehalococcoidia bacterium]